MDRAGMPQDIAPGTIREISILFICNINICHFIHFEHRAILDPRNSGDSGSDIPGNTGSRAWEAPPSAVDLAIEATLTKQLHLFYGSKHQWQLIP